MKMKKLHKSLFFYLALLAFLPVGFSIPARGEIVTDTDRFELWNDCKPISLIVEEMSPDATKIGLSKESITTTVRSRLRAARLYDGDSTLFFHVVVLVLKPAYSASVRFYKEVTDIASNSSNLAVTWSSSSTGIYGQGASYIMSDVSEKTDEFIDEYLRVNQSACK